MNDRAFPFTQKRLRELPAAKPGTGRAEYHDANKKGLTLRVTEAGVKTFTFHGWINGKAKRATIGRFPEVSLDVAHRKVDELWGAIALGNDPIEARRKAKQDPTFAELFAWYVENPGKKKQSTLTSYRQTYDAHLKQLASKKASAITKVEIRALHERITKAGAEYAANRTLALVRAIYNKAIKEDRFEGTNPALGIQLNEEKSREVRLLPPQLGAFIAALEGYPDV